MPGGDWIPTKKQDLVDLVEKWKTLREYTAKIIFRLESSGSYRDFGENYRLLTL
jgi:hypothetical protein